MSSFGLLEVLRKLEEGTSLGTSQLVTNWGPNGTKTSVDLTVVGLKTESPLIDPPNQT